jgi:hypothetical protein
MRSLFAISLVFALAAGCSAKDDIEQEIDCHSICDRYSECFDADYDVSACQDSCEDSVDADPSYMDKVDACENCIDDRSCTNATFACATECAGIVP